MHDQRVAWLLILGIVIVIPIINSLLRRRKTPDAAKPLPEDDNVRPKHIPFVYSWDDWIRDIYSAGVSTDLIMEKIRWCGMPKRPKPETTTIATPVTITVEGVSSGTGVGGTYTPAPTWVGGMVIPSTTIDPNPPYYNNISVSSYVSGYNGSYYNGTVTNVYPSYASSYINTNRNYQFYGTSSNIMMTSSNMASFTHATFNG